MMKEKTIDKYLHLAQKEQQQGNLASAITIYRQAILEFPQNYQLYNNLGKVLVEQGDFTEAIAFFRQGIQIKPDVSWLYYHLAEALQRQDKIPEAILNYQQAIKLDDDVYWFYFHLGQALSKQQNFTQAIESYHQAIARGMESPWVHSALGQAFAEQGDLQGAISSYEQGIAIDPNLSSFYENIYFLKRRLAQGNSENDQINHKHQGRNQPDQLTLKIQSLQSQAIAHTANNDLELALACYQKIIQLDSNYGAVFYQIGKIYQELNQIDTAQDYYKKASVLEKFDDDSKVLAVYFSARHITPRCRYHFLDLVAEFPGKKLFIRDIEDAWYNKGLPGLTKNIRETSVYLKNIIEQQSVEKIVFFGSSSGGYAALLFGYLLDVDQIHAFCPQTKIPNNPEEIKLLQGVESGYFDLAAIYQTKPISSDCHLYFDSQFLPDVEHAQHLKQFSSVELHGYEAGIGHPIALWLKHQQLLQPIILNALN